MRDDSSNADGGASIAIVVGLALLLLVLVVGSLGFFVVASPAPTPRMQVFTLPRPPQAMTIEPEAPLPDVVRAIPGESSTTRGETSAAPASTPASEASGGPSPAGK